MCGTKVEVRIVYFDVYVQIVSMTRNNDIQFCKGFWGLAENSFMHVSLLLQLFIRYPL